MTKSQEIAADIAAQGQAGQSLDALVKNIHGDMLLLKETMGSAARLALNIGGGLREAQKQVDLGKWERWLEDNFALSKRSAQRFMQLAEHRAEVEAELAASPDLSLRAAVRLITVTKPKRHTVSPSGGTGHSVAAPKLTILQIWEGWSEFEQRAVLAAMPRAALVAILPEDIRESTSRSRPAAPTLPLLSARDLPADAGNDDLPEFLRRTAHSSSEAAATAVTGNVETANPSTEIEQPAAQVEPVPSPDHVLGNDIDPERSAAARKAAHDAEQQPAVKHIPAESMVITPPTKFGRKRGKSKPRVTPRNRQNIEFWANAQDSRAELSHPPVNEGGRTLTRATPGNRSQEIRA
jgi:hypothetical protein